MRLASSDDSLLPRVAERLELVIGASRHPVAPLADVPRFPLPAMSKAQLSAAALRGVTSGPAGYT
jgi:hypothetical protein